METKEKIYNEAKNTVSSTEKLKKVVGQSADKLKKLASDSSEWKEFKSKINILIRMIQVHLSGEYKAFSRPSLFMIAFALIYFITPTDVIPDFIPAIGFTDDASVLYMIYRKISKDIDAFIEWSNQAGD